jgi:hypothetical protein
MKNQCKSGRMGPSREGEERHHRGLPRRAGVVRVDAEFKPDVGVQCEIRIGLRDAGDDVGICRGTRRARYIAESSRCHRRGHWPAPPARLRSRAGPLRRGPSPPTSSPAAMEKAPARSPATSARRTALQALLAGWSSCPTRLLSTAGRGRTGRRRSYVFPRPTRALIAYFEAS